MSEVNNLENNTSDEIKVEENLKEIMQKVKKQHALTDIEIKELLENSKESINFLDILNDIDIKDGKFRVIFTNGSKQLIYENGEFFLISSFEVTKDKKKLTKKEAKDMYLEYIITFVINPIIEKNNPSIKKINIEKNIEKKQEEKGVKKQDAIEKVTKNEEMQTEEKPKAKTLKEEIKKEIKATPTVEAETIEDVEEKFKNIIGKKPRKKDKIEIREQDRIK